jgi:CRP/FNR family transcriptional regulator, anaerobic regulatory protein
MSENDNKLYSNILTTVSSFHKIEPEDVRLIMSLFKPISVAKNNVLINKGEVSNLAYFVNSGYLRYYKNLETGEEQTIHLFSPEEFAASFNSFVNKTKSEEILHSVTDAELLTISWNDLEKLYTSGMKWQIFGRKLMEKFLLEKEKRIINQISLTAQERYNNLLETNPELIQNVPIQYIASFIGIKPESLSRIRRQIFLTNVK